jgi:serine/threonine protein kinase
MSPEQVIGGEVDGRTDQFSLGVILYQLLTGEKPFVGDSVTAISYQVVNVDPPPPSKLNPALRPSFDRIMRKAVAKIASDRYARCQDLAADLKTAVVDWKASAEQSTPPTLVSREDAKGQAAEPASGGARGITFLAPRFARLLAPGGSPLGIGWIAFLVCLVLLASAPFLLYRSPAGRAGPQRLGLLTSPASSGPQAKSPEGTLAGLGVIPDRPDVEPARAARLRLTLQHRFDSGRIEVRLDGSSLLDEKLKSGSGKNRFVRTLAIASGNHRVEVRVVSGKNFDDIVGIQGDFRPQELKNLNVSVSPMSKRLKARFDEPPAGTARP